MTVTKNYNNAPMTGLTEYEYETLHTHLTEHFQDDLTALQWLKKAGDSLDVDTSACVGV